MRKLFTLLTSFVLLAWMAVPEAQAQGNSCATAVPVTPGSYVATSPTTVGGTYDATCFPGPFNAAWYSYTPAATGNAQVSSCAGAVDTRLSIFSGACGAHACAASNDDAPCGNFASDATAAVTGGQTYYIMWDDRWGDVGNFAWDLTFSAPPPPPTPGGTTACGAVAVTAGSHNATSPTTVGGTYDAGCFAGSFNASWYSFTSATAGTVQVSSCAGAVDTRLSIFSGPCATPTCIASNDDAPCGNFASDATACITAGQTIYIQWDDRWGDVGAFAWDVTFTPAPPLPAAAAFPYSEDFEDAGALDPNWTQDACDDFDWTVRTGGTPSINTGPDAAQGGAYYIYTETSGIAASSVATIYPQRVNMTGSSTPRLNFWYHMRGAAMTPDGTIDIDVATSGSTAGPWTNIFTASGEIGNIWNQGLVSLAAYSTQTNLLFRINGTVSTTAPSFENDFGIDTWGVEDTPPCSAPIALTATNIGSTTADLGWTEAGTSTSWNVEVGTAGFAPTGTPTASAVGNPYGATGLSSGTSYDFYVQADCGINGFSAWSGPFTFLTNPSCGDSWYDNGGSGGTYANNSNDVTTICGAGGDYVEATFNSFQVELGWDALYVYDGPTTGSPLIASGQGPTTNFPADGWGGTTNPGPFTSNHASGCLTFEFLSDGSVPQAGWDVSITCTTCPAPTSFGPVTITATSVTIGGTANPAHLNYDMEIGPTGFTPGTGTSALGVGNNHPFTGLTQNTTYDVYVAGNCVGPSQSPLFGPITFTTLCGTQTFPYAEDWEDGGAFDQCWTQEAGDSFDYIVQTGGTPSAGTGPAGAQSGTYYLFIETSGPPAGSFATIYSPPINMAGSVNPRLNFYAQNNGASMNPDAATTVDISTTGAGGPWTNLFSQTGNLGAVWNQTFTNLAAYTGNTVTFRITSQMSSGGGFTNDLAIDGFTLEETPACAAPNSLAAAPASTTADLSWNETGTATLWDIEVGASGFAPTGTPTTAGVTNPYTETGLTSNTAYQYYVRADCGLGSASAWVGPFAFATAPSCGNSFYDNGGPLVNYPVNSNVVTTICGAGGDFVFATFNTFNTEGGWDALYVYDGPSTGSPIIPSGEPATTGGFPADGYSGTTIPGPFVSSDPTGCLTFEFLSDASVTRPGWDASITCVTCPPPSSLALSGVTASSGTITWTAGPSAVTETVQWGPTGFAIGTGTNIPGATSPRTITGLAASTTYDAYVRSDCGGSNFSPWIGPITFTTLCAPAAFPYTEDFEDGGALDACWVQETATDDYNWTVRTGGTPSTGTGPTGANSPIYYIYTESSGTANNDIAIIYSQLVNMTGAVNPRLNASYHALGVAMANGGSITIDISTAGSGGPWTNLFTQTGNTGVNQWFNATANLTAYIGQTVMFRITGINSTSGSSFQNDHAIDDFLVEETPPCVDPTLVSAIGTSGTTAQVTFTGDPGAVDYEIEHGLAGFAPTGTPTVTGIPGSPYTLTGLTASTAYDLYIRANCGVVNGNSNWIGPVSFSTLCPAFALPYLEDFEDGGALDACWSQENSTDDFDWTVNSGGTTSGGTGPTAANGGTYYIYTETSTPQTNSDVAIVYSAQVDLTAASDPRLNMWYHMLGGGMAPDGTIDVDISTTGPLGPWTNVFSQSGPQGAAWLQTLPNLSAYIGSTVMFRVVGTISSSGTAFLNDFAVDDFMVEETPLCPVPSAGFGANATASTADLNWTAGGVEVLWNTEVGLAGFAPTGTPTQTGVVQGYQETGLTSATDYEFYVQADCGGAFGVSTWAGPFAFSTALTCGDTFTDSGGAGGNYSVNENIVNTICGNGSDFAQVTFTAFNTESNWDALYVFNGPSTASPIIPSGNPATTGGFPPDGYVGTTIPGPFTSTDASGCLTFQFLSDASVTRPGWEAGVTCVTCLPIDGTTTSVTGLTSTTATVNWGCTYCSGGYVVEWGVAGFTVGTGTIVAVGAGPTGSAALTGLTPATAYDAWVRVDCGGGDISSDVLITFSTPPVNDDCGTATAVDVGLIGGYCTTGITASNVGATDSGTPNPSCYGLSNLDVWFSFVAPTSGEVMIEAAPTGGSILTDMVMALYDACGGTEIDCDDDSGPGLFPFMQVAGLTSGNTYYVRVWEYGGNAEGEFDFCVTQPSAASNDNICGAFNLTPITTCSYNTYSNLDATLDPIPVGCSSMLGDVWFQVVVPAGGDLILSSLPGAFSPLNDMVMEVFTAVGGCTGTLTSIACDDDSGPGLFPYLSLTGLTPGETLYVRMADFGFGTADYGSFQLAAFPYAIWSGDISTAFPTAGNWCSQVTPGFGDNVGIEPFPTNPMVLTGDQTVGDFLGNNPVTSLQIDPGVTLNVEGDAFISNIGVDGTVAMNGSAGAQTLNIGLPVTLGGLHVNNPAGVTYDNGIIGAGLSITGGLSLEAGHLSVVGGALTIIANAAGTGWVDDFSAGYTGSVDPITIQGYLPDNYIHFISSPVNTPGLQAQYSEFGASGPDGTGVTPSVNCSPDSLGQGSAYSFVLEWREGGNSGTGWASGCYQSGWHVRSSGTLTNARSYSMAHPSGGPWTMSVSGPVNTGTVTYGGGLTATGGAPAQALGWHLVGNPFPSPITWNAPGGSNLLGVANLWQGSSPYQGTYVNLLGGTQVGIHQGFAARTLTGGASYSVGPADRVTGSVPLVREAGGANIGDYSVTINLSGGGFSHFTQVYFANEASPGNYPTTGFDACCDGFFLPGSTQPYLYTVITDAPLPPAVVANEFQTNALPLLTESYSVPMGFIVGVAGTYTLDATDLGTLPVGFTVELEDTKLGTTQMLTNNPSYTFTAALNDDVNRFILHFNPGSVTDLIEEAFMAGSIFASDEEIVVRLNTMEDFQGTLDVYDLVGNLVMTSGQITVANGFFSMDADGLSTGVYIATLRSGEFTTENKIFIK